MPPAWSLDPTLPAVWLEGGGGIAESSRGGNGGSWSAELAVSWRRSDFVAVRDFSFFDTRPDRVPGERLEEEGLLYGRRFQTGHALALTAIGVGWVRGRDRLHVYPHLADAPTPFPYEVLRYRAVSVAAEAQTVWAFRFGGVGLALRADASPLGIAGAAELTLSLGMMPFAAQEQP